MPGPLLHLGAVITCAHLGQATPTAPNPRVLVSGQPVATMTSQITVVGCPFTVPGPKPQPCVLVKWTMPTARVLVMAQPAMVQPSPGQGAGMCFSGPIPNGPPIVSAMQPRVFAT